MPDAAPNPRLVVTDALGRRIVNIDKPLFTIGRRSETDLRLPGADISRVHAEISIENGACIIRDKQSRFGTFVNGEKHSEKVLAHGDQIRLGQAGDTEIVFFVDDEAPSVEKSAVSAASELRQMAALLEGLRALGSGRVLDEVLAMVLDSAIEVTGAERGFIMLANRDAAARVQAGAGARQGDAVGPHLRDQPQDSRDRVLDRPADDRRGPARRRSRAAAHRHRRARHPPRAVHAAAPGALRRARRSEGRRRDHRRAVSRQPRARRAALGARAVGARHAVGRSGAGDRERAPLPRGARQGEVRTGAEGRGGDSAVAAAGRATATARSSRPRRRRSPAARSAATSTTTSICRPAQFGFIIGDVAGKGSPAALLAAAVLGMFSAEATYQAGAAPLMTRLNHGLFRRAIEARFLTSFYGMLSPDGSLTYCNAGHNAPLLVTASGIRRLETGGVVLGLFDTAPVRRGNADSSSPAI